MSDSQNYAWRKLGGVSTPPANLLRLARSLQQHEPDVASEPPPEEVREAAYAAGFEEGLTKGLQKAEAQARLAESEFAQRFEEMLYELELIQRRTAAELQEQTAGFLAELFRTLFKYELTVSEEVLENMIEFVLSSDQKDDAPWATLKLSADLFDSIGKSSISGIELVAEPSLQGMRMELLGIDQLVSFDPQANLHNWLLTNSGEHSETQPEVDSEKSSEDPLEND